MKQNQLFDFGISGKRDCGGNRDYAPLAFLSSAEIAGTTS